MIDVVFQLIIFFLVSSHLAKQESQLPLPLPLASSGVDPAAAEDPRLTINVLEEGQLIVGGRPSLAQEIAARIREKQSAVGSEMEVRIRSDRTVPYRMIEPILSECAKSRVSHVTFAVHRSGASR